MRGRLEDMVLHGRTVILAVVTVITMLAAVSYWHIEVENGVDAWFAKSDPDYQRYSEFRELFEADETLFVVLHAPDLFTTEVLGRIEGITRIIEALPQVTRTVSLTNIEDIRGNVETLSVEPLVPHLDLDDQDLARLRRRVLADPFFPAWIVSSDGRTTVIVAEIGRATSKAKAALVDAVETATAGEATPGLETHLAGWPAVTVLLDRLTQADVRERLPLSQAILALCLWIAFRALGIVVVICVAVLVVLFWTMGTFAVLGIPGTFLTVSALPGILFALSLATCVHVVARFREENVHTPDVMLALRQTLRGIAAPVILTCATTAIGFGSLVIANFAPVRHLALFAVLGMAFACLISLTVVPVAVLTVPPKRLATPNVWLGRVLMRVADLNVRYHRRVLAVSLGVALVAGLGVTKLRPQGSNLRHLPAGSAPLEAMRFIEDHFGGASPLEVLVSGPPDVLKDPVVAETVAEVQRLLASYPEVTATFAYTDLLRRMNQALHDGDPSHYSLPKTRPGIAQQLLLYETSGGEELPRLLDVSDYDTARVSGRMTSFLNFEKTERFHKDLAARLNAMVPPSLRLEISGEGPLWLRLFRSLFDTLAMSLAVAFAGVAVVMMFLMGSVRLGLLAMIPNLLPVLVAVGTMGWIGVDLDFATVMVAGIALGIAVDDTIHYLFRFRRELASGATPTLAMRRTLTTVGKAMVATSMVLFVGFGLMLTSNLPPHRTFGVIIAFTMIVALAGDLFLLPALLRLVRVTPARQGSADGGA